MSALNRWWLWLALNICGIGLFFALAVRTWIEPELANEPGASGGAAIVWAGSALPVFLLFIIANSVLGIVAARQFASGRRQGAIVVAITLSAWIASFYFDGIHHGM